MTTRACTDCGRQFFPRADYAVRCFPCWRTWKAARGDLREPRQVVADPRLPPADEWQEMLPRLLRLAHPDRHRNSKMSTAATQWLLEQRNRLVSGAR